MKKVYTFMLVALLLLSSLSFGQNYSIDNVVIVLDASGSMGDTMKDANGRKVVKMEAAKQALHEVLKTVPQTTEIGLLVFESTQGSGWFYKLGPRNDAKLKAAINSIRDKGGTPLGKFIKIGADKLLEKRDAQFGYGSYHLLVVTDGAAGDEDLMKRYAPDVLSRGITLDVIGVAMSSQHSLAKMAHSYRAANDPEALKAAVKEVFAEIGGSGTSDATEEAFAELAAIPDEVAMAMITALSNSGNHPIGTRPKPKVKPQPPVPQPVVKTQTPKTQVATPPAPNTSSGGVNVGKVLISILVGVVVIAVIGFVVSRKR